ncbi:MAG: stage 0 sporulation family protein [Dehalococcoidia bacterium]|nr:stage 0 sporulation family protein [Dehalococcoidia bacterium]
MPEVVGIRFKRSGKIYYFDPASHELIVGEQVVVDTARGSEIGSVVIASMQILESDLVEPLKPVIRKAEAKDLRQMEHFKGLQADVLARAAAKVAQTGLTMKLLTAEYNFDGSRLTIFFSSEGRVDFRELVRELAATFRTRIELRQVGVRDEAKLIGGMGRCGRVLCCANYLSDFPAVSIKMAKEQDLPLNPMKISGVCGRLMCCLGYENDQYCEMKRSLPRVGEEVTTPVGKGKVASVNVLKETAFVQLESLAMTEVPVAQLSRKDHVVCPECSVQPSPVPAAPSRKRKTRESGSGSNKT